MAKFDSNNFLKALSPKVMLRAFQSFDRHTMVIVSTCWLAALVAILFALYSVWLVGTTKREIAVAQVMEPNLPQIMRQPPGRDELKTLSDRLQKQYPELSITLNPELMLSITTVDGTRYKAWLSAISYLDTISPQYRWSIKELCAGSGCPNTDILMNAKLVAEKVSFTVPEPSK